MSTQFVPVAHPGTAELREDSLSGAAAAAPSSALTQTAHQDAGAPARDAGGPSTSATDDLSSILGTPTAAQGDADLHDLLAAELHNSSLHHQRPRYAGMDDEEDLGGRYADPYVGRYSNPLAGGGAGGRYGGEEYYDDYSGGQYNGRYGDEYDEHYVFNNVFSTGTEEPVVHEIWVSEPAASVAGGGEDKERQEESRERGLLTTASVTGVLEARGMDPLSHLPHAAAAGQMAGGTVEVGM